MKHLLLSVFMVGILLIEISLAGEIPIDDTSYEDFIHVQRGRGLMALLGVPDADRRVGYSSWSFPSSIVVNDESYRIRQTSKEGGFKICSPTNPALVLARGGICRTSNAEIARVCGFGEIALNALPLRDLARQVHVHPMDATTNVFFLANEASQGERLEVLVAKNYFIYLQSATNNLAFALSVLNTGLPRAERLQTR